METLVVDIYSDEDSLPELAHWEECEYEEDQFPEGLEDDQDGYGPISFETQVLDPTLMSSIKAKCLVQPRRIKVSSESISTSIHRVPHILFQQDVNAYVPQVISIGPLHYDKRGDHQLQAIEEHKWRYLREIISRKGEVWLEKCMVAIAKIEKEARECYSQVIELDSDSFVSMMLLDGCFIIELFRKTWLGQFEDDPIFKLDWLHRELVIDLVMLENQIPFFVLQTMFGHIINIPGCSLKAAALKFFRRWAFYRNILPKIEKTSTSKHHIHHLLHFLHENIVLSTEKKYPPSEASKEIQCASKLQESGIKFKRRDLKNGAGNLLDIKFVKEKGIIEIPHIIVGDKTNTILRNLIAFEQTYLGCTKYITTYTFFMDCLINSSKDVEILCQKGIIRASLGSDEDVALLFNKIHREVILFPKSFYLLGVCKEINHYCGTAWPKLRATLMHDYFKNPWAVVSFTAAVLLLLLTMTQTFFSVFPKFANG